MYGAMPEGVVGSLYGEYGSRAKSSSFFTGLLSINPSLMLPAPWNGAAA